MQEALAPVCLFVYNRIIQLHETIEALKKNYLASASNLIIYSDGEINDDDRKKVNDVRQYIYKISGFKSIKIIISDDHKGLANSIIFGVSEVLIQNSQVIVLEDDLVTAPNFLDFMNQGLEFYANDLRIFNINGYSMDLKSLNGYAKDYYLNYRASSWGWATWKNRWTNVEWKVNNVNILIWDLFLFRKFMRGGSDMPYMLWKQINGKIDSWAIRWCYHQFKSNQLSVVATHSKVMNIGDGENATHTKNIKRFATKLDKGTKREFLFDINPVTDPKLLREFKQQHSILKRLMDRF